MTPPWEPVSSAQLNVLLSLIDVYENHGRATVRQVADRSGVNLSTAHGHLRALRRCGFAQWNDGMSATLRPRMRRVA